MKEGQNQQISEFKIQNVRTYNEVISSQDDWSLTRQDTHNKPNPEFNPRKLPRMMFQEDPRRKRVALVGYNETFTGC